jgi:hypothetical protein
MSGNGIQVQPGQIGPLLSTLNPSNGLSADASVDPGSKGGKLIATLSATGLATSASLLAGAVDAAASRDGLGLGTYLRTVARVTPTGVAATDVARRDAAVAAMRGVGDVVLLPGTHAWNTPCLLASSDLIVGYNAAILSTITPTGSGTPAGDTVQSVFFAVGGTRTASTTLGADCVRLSHTLTVADTTNLPPGAWVEVGKVNRYSYYKVRSRSVASGAGTIVVDRPILWTFKSGDSVFVQTPPRGIRLYGMSISGSGDRAIEIPGGYECSVDDVTVDTSAGFASLVCSFDVGSVRSWFRRVVVTGDNGATHTAAGGIALESADGGGIENSAVIDLGAGAACAIYIADSMGVRVVRTQGKGANAGITFDATAPDGNIGSGATDCDFSNNVDYGVQCQGASNDVEVKSSTISKNGVHGAYVPTGNKLRLVDSLTDNNYTAGVAIDAGGSARISGGTSSGNGLYGVDCAGDVRIRGLDVVDNAYRSSGGGFGSAFHVTGSAPQVDIKHCRVSMLLNVQTDVIYLANTGGDVRIDGVRAGMNSSVGLATVIHNGSSGCMPHIRRVSIYQMAGASPFSTTGYTGSGTSQVDIDDMGIVGQCSPVYQSFGSGQTNFGTEYGTAVSSAWDARPEGSRYVRVGAGVGKLSVWQNGAFVDK